MKYEGCQKAMARRTLINIDMEKTIKYCDICKEEMTGNCGEIEVERRQGGAITPAIYKDVCLTCSNKVFEFIESTLWKNT